jgi:hypothetical protein
MSKDKIKDHISGVAQGNLNAAETLFGIDANAFKDIRYNPEALAALKDMQADAVFWAKNGEKIRKQIEILAAGTAEKTVTLATIASAVNKFGKPVINAKYQAALDQKKFGNFLEEKKLQAQAQFGQEHARHSTQMQFQQAENQLQASIFRANVQMRYNQLRAKAQTANQQFQEQHVDFVAQSAMQMGSQAPFLSRPQNIPTPIGGVPSTTMTPDGMPGLPMGTNPTTNHWGSWFGNAVSKVRNWFGI